MKIFSIEEMRSNPSFSPFFRIEDGDSKRQSPFVNCLRKESLFSLLSLMSLPHLFVFMSGCKPIWFIGKPKSRANRCGGLCSEILDV
jgi:hypothetical protein